MNVARSCDKLRLHVYHHALFPRCVSVSSIGTYIHAQKIVSGYELYLPFPLTSLLAIVFKQLISYPIL